jgi:outer membrane murein-binding lipoprotein Lpp
VELDEVADELYGVPPEDFVATRRQREEEARAQGDRVLAKSIAGLPKPSLAAWACNVLVREHREEIEQLVELGGLLREAQESLAGDQLRALSVQRNQLVAALSRQVVALTRQLGHPVSSGVAGQVEETLRAAMADPEAGEAVLSGRLTSPLSYSGLGTGRRPDLRVVPPPAERPAARAPSRRPTERRGSAAERRRQEQEEAARREEEARRAAEERRRRELAEAQQAADEATAAAEEAAAAVEAEQAEVDRLDARAEELQARVDELAAELEAAREECTAVGTRLTRAQRRRQTAARRAADAAGARDSALARLDELRGRG